MSKLTITAAVAAFSMAFGVSAMAENMSKAEFKGAKDAIHAEYKTAKEKCDRFSANSKHICMAQAKGSENVALAELGERYHPGPRSTYDVRMARANADYSVAMQKCDDMSGNTNDVCVKEAKADYAAAKADAKTEMKTSNANDNANEKSAEARGDANKEIGAARKDARADKRDADYAVAIEKCDAFAGDTKDACVNRANKRYGKS